jgi:hypothetical protein
MKFTIYQLLADIFHNSVYQGRHELVITLPAGHEMSEKRAELIFLATLVNGAPRNVHYSTLDEISSGVQEAPPNVVPFPPLTTQEMQPLTPLQCEHRQELVEQGGLKSPHIEVTEGTPFHPGW